MLIKKSYGDRQKRSKQRNWQLQMMDREMDATMATANQDAAEQDYHVCVYVRVRVYVCVCVCMCVCTHAYVSVTAMCCDIYYCTFYCRFDLSKANLNDANLEKMKPTDIPDVVSGVVSQLHYMTLYPY